MDPVFKELRLRYPDYFYVRVWRSGHIEVFDINHGLIAVTEVKEFGRPIVLNEKFVGKQLYLDL